jgi:hypothetical protein
MVHRTRFGTDHLVRRFSADDSIEARIGRRIAVQPNGCWIFNGKSDQYGHQTITVNGHKYCLIVHRWMYELANGPIPDDHHVHHECKTPGCVNPLHLVALSAGDHARHHHAERRSA